MSSAPAGGCCFEMGYYKSSPGRNRSPGEDGDSLSPMPMPEKMQQEKEQGPPHNVLNDFDLS